MVGQQGIIEAAGIYLELIVRGGEEYLNALPATSHCTHGWWNFWYDEFRKCIHYPLLHGYTRYNWGRWNKYLDIIVIAGEDYSYTGVHGFHLSFACEQG